MEQITSKNCKEDKIEYYDFYFSYNTPSLEDFENIVRLLSKEYFLELEILKQKRDNLMSEFSIKEIIQLASQHKILINKILAKILELYKPLLENKPVGVFWNGSLARNNNRLSGDYDLNFVYSESLRSTILPIEEQICLLLSLVVNKPRDLVHATLVGYLPLLKSFPEVFTEMIFRMHWPDGNIKEYKISSGLENSMFRKYWANKDPLELEEYLLNSIAPEKCYDWSSTYEIIYGNDVIQPILNKIAKKEKTIAKNKKYILGMNSLINKYHALLISLIDLSLVDMNEIKNIKEYYKKQPFENIFLVLALIRRRLLIEGINMGSIKIDKYFTDNKIKQLLGKELTDRFFNQIFHYIWSIIRLEAIFEKKNIRFGTHSKEEIDFSFNDLYMSECPDIKSDFHINHNLFLRQLYSVLDEVIIKLHIENENGKS
ncbi:MAG: hypothetical protein Q7S33_05020 [Nanoarchaeota archaeon]|nr:hypothetical protein [Nanoarchaeota archaeon]